jgi:hypothetical protein
MTIEAVARLKPSPSMPRVAFPPIKPNEDAMAKKAKKAKKAAKKATKKKKAKK